MLVGCGPGCATVDPTHPPPAPPPAPIGDDCEAVCDRGRELRAAEGFTGCRWSIGSLGPDHKPNTGDEATCEQVCADTVASPVFEFPAACVAAAESCAAADACFQ